MEGCGGDWGGGPGEGEGEGEDAVDAGIGGDTVEVGDQGGSGQGDEADPEPEQGHEPHHSGRAGHAQQERDGQGLDGEDDSRDGGQRPASAKHCDQDAPTHRPGAQQPGPGRREGGRVLLFAQVGDQVDGDRGSGQGGRDQRRGQPPQGLVLSAWRSGTPAGASTADGTVPWPSAGPSSWSGRRLGRVALGNTVRTARSAASTIRAWRHPWVWTSQPVRGT